MNILLKKIFMNLLKIFMPKDRVFYSLFEEIANTVAAMGTTLKRVVCEPEFDRRASLVSELETMEHINDELTHKVFTELGRNFITPFDREDIHYLASALDDVADYIYAAAKKINFYRVNPNDTGIQKMADPLVKVNSIENQADDIYDMSIDRMFDTEPDAKEVIKKREIYQAMENATDKCE